MASGRVAVGMLAMGFAAQIALAAEGPEMNRTVRHAGPGYRAVLKVRQRELPAWERETGGRTIRYQESPRTLVRQVAVDGPVTGGRFVRTTRTLTIESDGKRPLPPAARGPSARNAPYLVSSRKLGPLYEKSDVKVRLFAPRAQKAELVVDDTNERVPMSEDRTGVWEARLGRAPAALYGKRYHFEVDGKSIADPYGAGSAGDYGPSRFVDLRFGWQDAGFKAPKLRDLVISEAHVKDMTASPSAPVARADRGTYRGLASPSILDHYKTLGAGAIELMPVQEYDDASGDHGTANHWGYNPTQLFAPERRYSSAGAGKPGDENAPHELASAIDAFHRAGRAVMMDVVYNHTATGPALSLVLLDKHYYFRFGSDGTPADGAHTGNELAADRPMVRRMIVDSLRHFVESYHVDGFRLDLGSLLDPKTMVAIDRALPKRVYLTAEPWAADADRARWGKGDLAGLPLSKTRLAVWNDDFRNAANDFLVGKGERSRLMTAIAGSEKPYGWATRPQQSVNYLESHDELTVADRVGGDPRRALLGATLLLTSQGVPLLGHGQEFMRSKQGISNAHNLDNEVSWLDWRLKTQHKGVFDATAKLIALRQKFPHFRYDRPLTDRDIEWLKPANERALGYLLHPPPGTPGRKQMGDMLVLLNSDPTAPVTFELPAAAKWTIVMDGQRVDADQGLGAATARYTVPAGTAAILRSDSTSREIGRSGSRAISPSKRM